MSHLLKDGKIKGFAGGHLLDEPSDILSKSSRISLGFYCGILERNGRIW